MSFDLLGAHTTMAVPGTPTQAKLVAVTRLTPSTWNPRLIKEERFLNLCRSIAADPDFLWRRPILASLDGTVYGGNMRLMAVQKLGWTEVPAIIDDIPDKLAKERALRDNRTWGEDQEQELAELLAELSAGGSEVDILGLPETNVGLLLDSLGLLGDTPTDGPDEEDPLQPEASSAASRVVTCPSCGEIFDPNGSPSP